MTENFLECVATWVQAIGREFDSREKCSGAHREVLGEVYLNVLTELNRVGVDAIAFPAAFVRQVARCEFPRACWRERKQAANHTPAREDSILESGVAIDRLGFSFPLTPLDEVIHQEERGSVATVVNGLSAGEQRLLESLTTDVSKAATLKELARQTGCTVRTLQRRRKALRNRLRREWHTRTKNANAGAPRKIAETPFSCRTGRLGAEVHAA
jgi:hypothetical protein